MYKFKIMSEEDRIKFERYEMVDSASKELKEEVETVINKIMAPFDVGKLKNEQYTSEEYITLVKDLKLVTSALTGIFLSKGYLDALMRKIEQNKGITVDYHRATELHEIFVRSLIENGK